MTAYTLLELIINYCQGDVDDTLIECRELLDKISGDKPTEFAIEFEREVEIYALSNNLCYLCGSELEVERNIQYSEYQGRQVSEEINQHQCSNYECSYVVGE